MRHRKLATFHLIVVSLALPWFAACGSGLNSDEEARLAYLGLDRAIGVAIDLGFIGFTEANNANIAPQTQNGELNGTLTVDGQVDQGASANKEMRLSLSLNDYADDFSDGSAIIVYQTAETKPDLDVKLANIPDGSFSGSLIGDFLMDGTLEGVVSLAIRFDGELEAVTEGATGFRRKPGTTTIVGTAISPAGIYAVNVVR